VTSSAVAHPRWTTTFGGEPPLAVAARELQDPGLLASLAALAPLRAKPVASQGLRSRSERGKAGRRQY